VTVLRYGYVTNGLRDHGIDGALELLAECGYAGVALTLDHGYCDPFAAGAAREVARVRDRLADLGLSVVVETGARFLLDHWRKHEPTLLSDDGRAQRIDFLLRAIDIAAELGAPVVSLWSGIRPAHLAPEEAWGRLRAGLAPVLDHASGRGLRLGFEPEPGMLVDTVAGWERLAAAMDHPALGITLDIGHCQCLEPLPPDECVRRVAGQLVHVHIEDMRRGVHEHLDFGDGEIDFPPVLRELGAIGYTGLVAVELSRHSHTAHTAVPTAIRFLTASHEEASLCTR
jgi:L-ribulose-5-phosphate 3-epimerase